MKKTKFAKSLVVGLLLALFGTLIQQAPAYSAEDSVDYRLAITPTQKGFGVLEPGQTYSDTFKVKNTGQESFDFEITFESYNITDEDYSTDYETRTQFNEIIDWLSVDTEKGTVKSGSEAEITYSFTVPDDAHGGAQIGTIMVTMSDVQDDQTEGIQAVRRLGYIVFGNVNGDIIETANILENKIPGFLFRAPIYAESIVENTGNIYSNASYTLQVFPLFSDEEVFTNEEDPEKQVIFPETKRYNKVAWEGSPQLGIFRVRQTVKLFDETSTEEKLVFICPIWFLFIVILVVILIIWQIVSRIIKGKNAE